MKAIIQFAVKHGYAHDDPVSFYEDNKDELEDELSPSIRLLSCYRGDTEYAVFFEELPVRYMIGYLFRDWDEWHGVMGNVYLGTFPDLPTATKGICLAYFG